MIIVVSSIKGAVGKSTVATNLACYLAQRSGDVILVDADYQATASDFNAYIAKKSFVLGWRFCIKTC